MSGFYYYTSQALSPNYKQLFMHLVYIVHKV